jgi:hypothetical protein
MSALLFQPQKNSERDASKPANLHPNRHKRSHHNKAIDFYLHKIATTITPLLILFIMAHILSAVQGNKRSC